MKLSSKQKTLLKKQIRNILKAKKLREKLGLTKGTFVSTSTLIEISGLEETDQKRIIVKIQKSQWMFEGTHEGFTVDEELEFY